MEKKTVLDTIPSRIKYYLLDWKDKNMNEYVKKYGELRLHDLTAGQIYSLYVYVTLKDIETLININNKL